MEDGNNIQILNQIGKAKITGEDRVDTLYTYFSYNAMEF